MTTDHPIIAPKKLIEVALPLDAINVAAAKEKSIRHGHPSTLHLWWARRPLAAARAVIFGQLVNDPASLWEFKNPGQKPSLQQRGGFTQRRNYLFGLISELVKWENTSNEEILKKARAEIRQSWREVCELNKGHPDAATLFNPDKLPGLHDPFAGGGAIPLEAQRLGLEAFASDLNPVAVLINKAMIEIPPKFAGLPPVHPDAQRDGKLKTWTRAQGLAEDVRRYGAWMREEAAKRIGHLYPNVKVTADMVAARPELQPFVEKDLKVIAWLWARTAKSPNPAFSHVDVPLVSSFVLATKPGKEAWLEPVVEGDCYRFLVRSGKPSASASGGTKAPGRGGNFRCIISGTAINGDYIKKEGQAGRMGVRLLAVVAEGNRARVYLPPTGRHEEAAVAATSVWRPTGQVPSRLTGGTCVPYGLREWGDLFTPRQLVALTTFSDLVGEARVLAERDAVAAGLHDDGLGLEQGGSGARAYGDAMAILLSFVVDKETEALSTLCTWSSNAKNELVVSTFRRQALPMTWDFAESNPFASSSGAIDKNVDAVARVVDTALPGTVHGTAVQGAAQELLAPCRLVSTDPPYYDNIGYADLSDYFYVWLRRTLRPILPSLFATMAVPKSEELVATPYRHGSKEAAEAFFLDGMTVAMARLSSQAHPGAPVAIYYAFKQSETGADTGTSSTGWETFLEAVLRAGFAITGTWPMRTERGGRSIGIGTNALASSIILVCRKRADTASTVTRREFLRELNAVLPVALDEMTKGAGEDLSPVAPVDLSMALIGPGMAVYSKYAAVEDADGSPMSVRTALQLINRFVNEEDFDADTQFCLHWFESHRWSEGSFGEADVLARAKATSVGGLEQAGVAMAKAGKVRVLRPSEYPAEWDPKTDKRLPVWEALHHLVRVLRKHGESGAGRLLADMVNLTENIRQLAYRLYTLCERKGWAEEARDYNDLVKAWTNIETAAQAHATPDAQMNLL